MNVPPSAPRADLEIEGLVVGGDGRPAVSVPRLHVAAGTCAVVTGAAGAGASTLAAGIAGHLPAAGEVRVGGRRCTGPPSRRRRAGLAAVLPELPRIAGCTVSEALALSAHGRTAADALDRFPVLAARAGLRAERLSGGEHLLLRTACAWVSTPPALMLDSPTTGLAEALVADVVDLARQEAARGAAVLWIDRDGAPTPAPPAWRLGGGMVSALARSRTGSTTATG